MSMETVADAGQVVIARAVGEGPTQTLEPLAGLEKVRQAHGCLVTALQVLYQYRVPGGTRAVKEAASLLSEFLAAQAGEQA